MRKTILSLAIGFATFTVISCGENADAENEFEATLEQIEQTSSEPSDLNPTSEVNAAEQQSPTIQIQPDAAAAPSSPANPSSAKLNPEHGQPGHDCAIPVGAPLDGSAGSRDLQALPNQAPAISPAPITPSAPTFNNNASSGKINPPHGEPGHDCAVAVGAPLN